MMRRARAERPQPSRTCEKALAPRRVAALPSRTFSSTPIRRAEAAKPAAAPQAAAPAAKPAAPKKTVFGNLKDSDRIFTNLYGERSPFIDGALKRVRIASLTQQSAFIHSFRVTGTARRTSSTRALTGSSARLRRLVSAAEAVPVFRRV